MTEASNSNHHYEYDVDLKSDSAPARVIGFVAPFTRVLEIGAGPGSITRHLSGTKGCDVVALEVDETALPRLRPHVRRVISADLNDPAWSQQLSNESGFDFVIAVDVLEHVYDPLSILKVMKSF